MSPVDGPSPAQWARFHARNEARTNASVQPHLEPGEEVRVIQGLRRDGKWVRRLRFPRLAVTPATSELPKNCVFVVTSRRFLVVSHDYTRDDHVSQVVITAPLDEVRSVQLTRGWADTEVNWTARGTQYSVWMNKVYGQRTAEALQPGD